MEGAIPRTEKVKRGAVAIKQKTPLFFELDKADVVIMNPPFTSCDNLPKDYKLELEKRFKNSTKNLNTV
jgi:tRNA1(Val) A37 N6-methylase TrmN6